MKHFAFIIIALLFTAFLNAQDPLKEADAFFDEGNFQTALQYYKKAYKKDSTNLELRHNMAICMLSQNMDRKPAIPHLEWVVKQEKFDEYAWFDLAKAYHFNLQFDKAIKNYKKYIKVGKDDEFIKIAKVSIKQCENAKELIAKPIDVTFNLLNEEINTENNEYQPYIPSDESTLVYTSDEKYDSRYKIHINNIFISENENGEWDRPKTVGVVNSQEDEFVSGLAANDKYLFVKVRRYEAFDDIFVAEKDGDRISRLEDLGEPVNTGAVESGATLSFTGDTLIFASDRDGGEGGLDLWMAMRLPNGRWGKPVNLGKPVNTPYDEDFPHLMADGKTMFFSSNGPNSMGGFDVFKTTLNADAGKWAAPRNFGYPVNNTYDNLTIAMSRNYRYAYVSDVRKEGKGGMDIYRVVFNQTDANIFLHKGTFVSANDSIIDLPVKDKPEIKVLNKESGELFGKYQYNNSKQQFLLALPPGSYQLQAEFNGYKPAKRDIFVPDLLEQKVYDLKIQLEAE
ncbi:MAG TPA: tetratricopeptide repeat protein [Salinivirga sp.]|uniref:tetratricopeptide repeat protein n=1 Tax=Salinivirga sp. TaxID=1970192 RepID=UPI002B4637F2|nr:tetratricopeptide repeat protein [Salinivirga sp.]HKK59898.1 tetratricopeptide repeat protein [Salinivirga sp.]